MHKPIQFKDLALSFPHKTCFADFSGQIPHGSRIGIIGRNGEGKSTLLKMLAGIWTVEEGSIYMPDDVCTGYLPQIIDSFENASGGERLNRALTEALCNGPNLLLLDEPTNHLDRGNRNRLMHMLQSWPGTLIVVSHDKELLRNATDTLWHIAHGKVHVFSGHYDDYIHTVTQKRLSLEKELSQLTLQKKHMHDRLMQEQERSAKSRARGEKKVANRRWLKMVGDLKSMKAEKSQGKKLRVMADTRDSLTGRLAELYQPEVIIPKFSITSQTVGSRTLVQIADGTLGYASDKPLLSNIDFTLSRQDRIALSGDNGSGKSTFVKAVAGAVNVDRTGLWVLPNPERTGYLDQHYQNLSGDKTVVEMLAALMPHATNRELRAHLNDFLFRKNEEVETAIANLSGGEKARLSLCCIAARTPALLILDEITNNLDLETREHVIQVLKDYPGAMMVISHDSDFLKAIGVEVFWHILDGRISRMRALDE